MLSGGLNEWSSLYTHLMSNPRTTKPEFSQSSTIESALNPQAGYQSANEILQPKPKPTPPKPAPIKAPNPIPIADSKPTPTTAVPMDTPKKDDEISNLKKERADLELQRAKIRKKEAEKEKLRRNGFFFYF